MLILRALKYGTPSFRKLLNPKPYRSLIETLKGTLIDPFKGAPKNSETPKKYGTPLIFGNSHVALWSR